LSCLALWCLSHAYLGLFHDAGLYTLQALAHRDPRFLAQDVFLKFGSQDRFTLFSPLFAALSGPLGIEVAAALLTLVSQIALVAGAWSLARAVTGALPATLGIAVLLAVPGDYGAGRIFTCLEGFLTPRMAAEALCLFALTAAVHGRRRTAWLLVAGAVLLHPLMAAAGVVALLWREFVPRRTRLAPVLAAAAVLVLALVLIGAFGGRFDDLWLGLVERRSPYLFLTHWQWEDWMRVAVCLITLALGRRSLANPPARTLAEVSFVATVGGLALTALAVDGLHLVIFTQLQPWRWQWLGTLVAAVLLPQILVTLWRTPVTGRTSALLLVSAWLFGPNGFAAAAAGFAMAVSLTRVRAGEARLLLGGAWALLAIAVAWRVASNLEFTDAFYADSTLPWWLRRTQSFSRDGAAPLALIAAGCWLAADARRRRVSLPMLGALAAAACAALLPFAWQGWTSRDYPERQSAALLRLRERIPRGAEVFAPESPVETWALLGRPSYLSVLQTSGLVFSRAASLELDRRAKALKAYVSPDTFMSWGESAATSLHLSREQLLGLCRTGEFAFLETSAQLGPEPDALVPGGPRSAPLRLYRCSAAPGV
jgi:hypothetical protein